MRVAVVGAGICGASAARFLAERGHSVTLYEQFELGHSLGSSHGRSRIVRRAYPDAFYTACMAEAYPMWAELQARSDLKILHEVGLLYFGSDGSADLKSMIAGLSELDVEHRILSPTEARKLMPALRLEQGEIAVFTPEAGWVHAQNALRATLALAQSAGCEVRPDHKASRQEMERFDAFVICAGAWVSEWADLDVSASLHTFVYIEGLLEGPVWIEDSPEFPYGFPSEPGAGTFKIGVHRAGIPVDPDSSNRSANPKAVELAADAARRRFDVKRPNVIEAKGCLYTGTLEEDFRLGRLDEHGFIASACSGHGYKFGPWIGKLLADFVEGKDEPERHARFFRNLR